MEGDYEHGNKQHDSTATGFSSLAGHAILASFLILLVLYGGCITGLVFKEPDICFLLAGGRWIIEHGQIPAQDPFSYTTHYHWAAYVIEKWLTEVIFYFIYSTLGCVSLLVFDAIILSTAFVVMPFRIAYRTGWRGLAAMGWVLLVILTSCNHLAVRPEVFSFLLTAIWMEVLVAVNNHARQTTRIHWRSIALIAVLMCLWSNLHTLFMAGIFLPMLYCGCLILERFIPGLKTKPLNWTVPIMAVVCLAASLINPYGFGLWAYMPNVFGPFNDTNNEMQPISLRNAVYPFFYPFYAFIIAGFISLWRRRHKPLDSGDLFFRLLIPLGAACGIKTVRSIPLSGLFLLGGSAQAGPLERSGLSELLKKTDAKLDQLTRAMGWKWYLCCVVATALGTILMTSAVPPDVPQPSKAFTPPFKAIEFIEKNPPHGNLLNDPHFGAVMLWKMRANPPVFIDPRYNLYGNDLLQDYWRMVDCKDGWKQLMSHYNIGWIFLPPNLQLPQQLAHDSDWKLLYSDRASVIYAKKALDDTKPR